VPKKTEVSFNITNAKTSGDYSLYMNTSRTTANSKSGISTYANETFDPNKLKEFNAEMAKEELLDVNGEKKDLLDSRNYRAILAADDRHRFNEIAARRVQRKLGILKSPQDGLTNEEKDHFAQLMLQQFEHEATDNLIDDNLSHLGHAYDHYRPFKGMK
jgi:hypothetical protein